MDELLDLEPLENSEFETFYCTGYYTLDGLTPIQARIMYWLRTDRWISYLPRDLNTGKLTVTVS